MEDVYHVPCGHWAIRPRIYHRCVGAPDQPKDQLHTVPALPQLEAQVGKYREHGDSSLPKPGMRMSSPCTNAVTCGSIKDYDTKCGKCRIDVEKIVAGQTGMWFSYSRDPVTGKARLKDRQAESATSQRARLKINVNGPRSGIATFEAKSGGMKNIPSAVQSTRQDRVGFHEEDSQSRQGSWSSHGHVEL